MFKNKSGKIINHPLVQQVEQDINKTKDSWETEEAQIFLGNIFGSHNPEDFEHLILDKSVKKITEYDIERMLHCYNLPYNYGNKTQYYMKWLVRKITMPDDVSFFNHSQFQGLINLQTLYHLGKRYKMQYFNKPYGESSIQSAGFWMLKGDRWVNPENAEISDVQDVLIYEPYSYVAIVHDAWQDKDIDMFRVQLPDMKNNKFYRPHFFVAAAHANNNVCASGLTENLAKQAFIEKVKNKSSR